MPILDLTAAPPIRDERLRAAALEAVARWGATKTSLDDVARLAGVSRATVYRAFPGGRDALMTSVAAAEIAEVRDAVTAALTAETELDAALVAAITTVGRWVRDHAAFQHLLRSEPETVLPYVSFSGLDTLLGSLTSFAAPLLERWIPDAAAAADGADYVLRIVLSHLFAPADTATAFRGAVDLADEASVHRLVARFVLPGITRDATHTRLHVARP